MDEEKKRSNTSEESTNEDVIQVISSADEFEREVKNLKDNKNKKSQEKKSQEESEEKDEKPEKESKEKEEEKSEEESKEKEDEKSQKESKEKEDEKPQEESKEKEEEKPQEESKEKEEEKSQEESEEKEEEKSQEESKEKDEEKSQEESKEKEEEKPEESEEKEEEKPEEKSKNSKKNKETDEKGSPNKAISQSKRLADAKSSAEDKNQDGTGSDKKEKKSGKKGFLIAFSIIFVLLLGTYFTGFWYFSSHFYTDVAINGTKVSNMDEIQAKQTLDNFYTAYILTMHTVDGEDVLINGKDIDMNIKLHEDFPRCFKEQKPYLWFIEIFRHHDFIIEADVSWNQDKLDDLYEDMDILHSEDIIDPADAYIGSDGSEFVIMEEVMGNRLDEDTFKQQVGACLQAIQADLDLKEADCYCKPSVYSDSQELKDRLESFGDYTSCVITLKLDDLELEPSIDLLDEVLVKNGSTYSVSEDKVESYVKKLAGKYDTLGKKRDFETSFGGKHIMIEGKNVGYQINQETTSELLYNAIKAKKATTVDVEFTRKGKTLLGENDIGDTYIEANLTKQKVIAYKDGKKFGESDCVSGNVSHGTGTCLGLYEIQGKQSPATLRGEKVPKSKTVVKVDEAGNPYEAVETTMEYSYESYVIYWMPFNGGYGLHDADGWRSSYGGNIYYYSGSHGCINLPRKFAEKLYKNFDVGTPVLVYYEEDDPNN